MADLAQAAAERNLSVLLSSQLTEDLERVCDYMIVLAARRVQIAGPVPELLAAHRPAGLQEMVLGYLGRAAASDPRTGVAR
jgi:ABC-2 type transport system ATP-binding protein